MKKYSSLVVAALCCAAFLWAETPSNTLGEPLIHKNLQIFLVTAEDRLTDLHIKTLNDAMQGNNATVRETGNVNQLSIQAQDNDAYVYVQAGDIVKGGRQDRTLASDLLLSPESGKVPLEAFCVEHGRWTGRQGESPAVFNASSKSLSSKELKLAAQVSKDQGEVWKKVGEAQTKLTGNVFKSGGGSVVIGNSNGTGNATTPTINDARSATSLQLSLENQKLREVAAEYLHDFQDTPQKAEHSVGFVYAVNGKISGAEIYANHALFSKLWSKLLESTVNEAIAEQKDGSDGAPLTTANVDAWLADTETVASKIEIHPATNVTLRKETDKSVRFDTLVPTSKGGSEVLLDHWIHRRVLSKEGMVAMKPATPHLELNDNGALHQELQPTSVGCTGSADRHPPQVRQSR